MEEEAQADQKGNGKEEIIEISNSISSAWNSG